jgi:hypothetical protein
MSVVSPTTEDRQFTMGDEKTTMLVLKLQQLEQENMQLKGQLASSLEICLL